MARIIWRLSDSGGDDHDLEVVLLLVGIVVAAVSLSPFVATALDEDGEEENEEKVEFALAVVMFEEKRESSSNTSSTVSLLLGTVS